MNNQTTSKHFYFCHICDKDFSLPASQVKEAEDKDETLLCIMCQSEFIEELERQQPQQQASVPQTSQADQSKEAREPDIDSQGNQFHSCESNSGDAVDGDGSTVPAISGSSLVNAAGEETKVNAAADDDDEWEDEPRDEEIGRKRARRGQQATMTLNAGQIGQLSSAPLTQLANGQAAGSNNGGSVQTQTFTDAHGNMTTVQVETVVQQIDVDLSGARRGQAQSMNSQINQLFTGGGLGDLGGAGVLA